MCNQSFVYIHQLLCALYSLQMCCFIQDVVDVAPHLWSLSVCWGEVGGNNCSHACSSSVAGKTQHDAAQHQKNGQRVASSSAHLIRSDAAFCSPSTDGEAASKRERPSFVHDSRQQINWDLLFLFSVITNKNYSQRDRNVFSGRIMVLIVSYLYDNFIFCVNRCAINHLP